MPEGISEEESYLAGRLDTPKDVPVADQTLCTQTDRPTFKKDWSDTTVAVAVYVSSSLEPVFSPESVRATKLSVGTFGLFVLFLSLSLK